MEMDDLKYKVTRFARDKNVFLPKKPTKLFFLTKNIYFGQKNIFDQKNYFFWTKTFFDGHRPTLLTITGPIF